MSRFISCKGRTGRQPSRIPSHDFHNRHGRNIIDITVARNLCKSGGNKFGRRAKSRTMVCLSEIVVDGLRSSHDLDIIHSVFPAVYGKLIDSIHRIVSAGINKISDIIFSQDPDDLLKLSLVFFRIFQFPAAGPQRCCRCHGQQIPCLGASAYVIQHYKIFV